MNASKSVSVATARQYPALRTQRLGPGPLAPDEHPKGNAVHTYTPLWPEDISEWERPDIGAFQYRSADDVARYAALEPLITWYTYPHVWHLDEHGNLRCSSTGSSLDDIHRFAMWPEKMLFCRETPVDPPCPNRWVILEPRRPERHGPGVNEGDARAFLRLRTGLAEHGIDLLDAVVFDREYHWWSMHELTSGTTTWA
jgi:hypothetical protein